MNINIHLVFLCIVYGQNVKPIVKLVNENGYPLEEHMNIQTPDGYLLTLHRIPYGKNGFNQMIREPVLLMHGLMGSAENFLFPGPEKGLGFLLADRGYDVWLGNLRSTSHSRHHITLNPDKDKAFWQFSLTELGVYDLPTKIDHILNNTGMPNLVYIGHSQGNIIMFILCSELPHYNEKVKLFVALSPIAYTGHMPHPWFTKLAKLEKQLEVFTESLGIYELTLGRSLSTKLAPIICALPFIIDICAVALFSVGGINLPQYNKSYIAEITKTAPEGISTKQLYHIFQTMNADRFQKYDYGISKNILSYNSSLPPVFNTRNTRVPAALFYSKNDWFLGVEDAIRISNELPNVIISHQMEDEHFTHDDFLFAKDVIPLLYSRVFKIMDQYRYVL